MKNRDKGRKKRLLLKNLGHFLRKNPFRTFSLTIVGVFILLLPGTSYLDTLVLSPQPPLVRASELDNFQPSPYPKRNFDEPIPYLTAEAVEILDLGSGVPVFEVNTNERLRPASITKLMTALVALDYYSQDQVLTVRRLAPKTEEESEMGLAIGDMVGVKSLIYGLLVPSGNDAAYTLADNFPGGIENFIYAMNKKARDLSMTNSHFANPSGLDQEGHYTSARDMAFLAGEALKNPIISKAVATSGITLGDATGKKVYTIRNVNQLLGTVFGVDGVKTGFTDLAGQCLVTSISRGEHRILIVLLKSQDRFGESARLTEWAFRNLQWLSPQVL